MISKPILRDIQSRFSFLLDMKTNVQRSLRNIRKHPFEAEYEILKSLKPNDLCAIDIGANRGQSIDAIRLYHKAAPIHAFEPNKGLYNRIAKKFGVEKNLTLHNYGLGDAPQSSTLYIPYYRKFMYDGLSSFSKDRASSWLNEGSVWRFNPDLMRIESHPCHIERLDKFSLSPFFIKIHVQGFELSVLKGAEQTISSHNPVLLMANNKDADIWLRARGWTQYVLRDDGKWLALKENDLSIYNCVYFNTDIQEHRDIIKAISV